MNRFFLALLGLLSGLSLTCQAQGYQDMPKYVNLHLGMVSREDVHFKKSKKIKVSALATLPQGSKTANYEATTYYYNDNGYYSNYGGRYIQVAPNPGLRVGSLPKGSNAFSFAGTTYYSGGGFFYKAAAAEYEVVDAQEGMIIQSLPKGSEKVTFEGSDYYACNDVLYHKINGKEGKGWQVVGLVD